MPPRSDPSATSTTTFSVARDDPFMIFQKLQDIARNARGDADTIDLSRGDPGYGFTPSRRGREFASFVLFLDTILNTNAEDRFLRFTEAEGDAIERRIAEATHAAYQEETAKRLLRLLREFLDGAKAAAEGEGKHWSDFTVLRHLFNYSAMSGGSYLRPEGQELSRVIVAAWHRAEMGVPVTSDDILLTNGASHAIGSLFKALGAEGCGYLREGDAVAIASPVYSPYNRILEERGLRPLSFAVHPVTGAIASADKTALRHGDRAPKALFLIDPNNPTGFSLPEEEIAELALMARERNMLVITDEVYSSFFPRKKTMLALCPERTICINARSKIERSTGLRFGEIITLPQGRSSIATLLGLPDATAFVRLLLFAKAPGRTGGQFQHTTFVPGPAQLLGIAHILLGAAERQEYLTGLRQNRDVFCRELALPHRGNLYYVIFDLHALPGCRAENLPMEEKLLKLAEAGVVYIPAYRFFAERDRDLPGIYTSVRASVVNTTPERLREAARRTKEVLC